MSVYADYNKLSVDYDSCRIPNGAHHYLGLVYSLTGKTKENLHLLDLGCGTGNHAKFLLDQGLGKATMLDANFSMLNQAKEKLKAYTEQGKAVLEHHKLPNIPYDDSSFDMVMCNQVIHHLVDGDKPDFSLVCELLQQAYRVLKPNGVLIIQLCTPFQFANCFWYESLYPKAMAAVSKRCPEPEEFMRKFRSAGFKDAGMIVEPLSMATTKEWYYNGEGPLTSQWPLYDSGIATAHESEVNSAKEVVQALKKEGKLEEYTMKADSMWKNAGQYAIYYAKK